MSTGKGAVRSELEREREEILERRLEALSVVNRDAGEELRLKGGGDIGGEEEEEEISEGEGMEDDGEWERGITGVEEEEEEEGGGTPLGLPFICCVIFASSGSTFSFSTWNAIFFSPFPSLTVTTNLGTSKLSTSVQVGLVRGEAGGVAGEWNTQS
jgi:hypothetical protein